MVERLASADAFTSLGLSRRQALWDARSLVAAPDLPLFAAALEHKEEVVDQLRARLEGLDIDALSPREALDLLVARTGLVVAQDRGTGALAVRLEARRPALPTGPPPPPPQPTSLKDFRSAGEEVPVQLSRFEVEADADTSYGALNSNSLTQFNTALNRTPVSADIFTEDFMRDISATSIEEIGA